MFPLESNPIHAFHEIHEMIGLINWVGDNGCSDADIKTGSK
jgi:hypothetical protein